MQKPGKPGHFPNRDPGLRLCETRVLGLTEMEKSLYIKCVNRAYSTPFVAHFVVCQFSDSSAVAVYNTAVCKSTSWQIIVFIGA